MKRRTMLAAAVLVRRCSRVCGILISDIPETADHPALLPPASSLLRLTAPFASAALLTAARYPCHGVTVIAGIGARDGLSLELQPPSMIRSLDRRNDRWCER